MCSRVSSAFPSGCHSRKAMRRGDRGHQSGGGSSSFRPPKDRLSAARSCRSWSVQLAHPAGAENAGPRVGGAAAPARPLERQREGPGCRTAALGRAKCGAASPACGKLLSPLSLVVCPPVLTSSLQMINSSSPYCCSVKLGFGAVSLWSFSSRGIVPSPSCRSLVAGEPPFPNLA